MNQPDGLLAVLAPRSALPGPRCTVGKAISRLGPIDRGRLQAMLDDDAFDNTTIANRLREHPSTAPLGVSYQSVARHRRRAGGGGCKCPI